ncbi:MAG: PQQ-dependent sugar dehydrogenase [Gemmataceae bacterium]
MPYRSQRAFPNLAFDKPVLFTSVPGTVRLLVAQERGKVFTFPNDQNVKKADLFVDLNAELKNLPRDKGHWVRGLYGFAFHPNFRENRYCYICYVIQTKKRGQHLKDGTRVSRFKVTKTDPPRLDVESEKTIITWLEGGHNGGCLKFGPDGFLYISTGDAEVPNPPDPRATGQDVTDLLSSLLRIDVDTSTKDKPYSIPKDNPFVDTPNARPEIWAFGFRNPWRMSFDKATGDLWVGDVGWERWEMIHRVEKGGNYGWSIVEGREPVRPNLKTGPTPILPPTIVFSHTEASSITGGYVYHGKRSPKLKGMYVCGDWATRTLWGAKWDGKKIASLEVLAKTNQRIVAFGEDHDGELYYLDHIPRGGIYQLVPNKSGSDLHKKFPRKLSETGLFSDTAKQIPAPGVLPFAIKAERWADHATSQRWVALPNKSALRVYQRKQPSPDAAYGTRFHFPKDAVLVKTLSLEMQDNDPTTRRHVETQILHFDGVAWGAYSYRWNEDQTDATLVPSSGAEATFTIPSKTAPGGVRQQKWRFHSRNQCLICHNPWAGYNLAFTPEQIDLDFQYDEHEANQLTTFEHIGVIEHAEPGKSQPRKLTQKYWQPLANPHDRSASIDTRARAYLHANCAHCHQSGAGGTALIHLRYDRPLEQTKAIDQAPLQGDYGIENAKVVATGDPYRSILYYRMSTRGKGHMPQIGCDVLDRAGLRLIHDWIRQLPIRPDEEKLITKLEQLGDEVAQPNPQNRTKAIDREAKGLARKAGRIEPTPQDRDQARRVVEQRQLQQRQQRCAALINQLLAKPSRSLYLLRALDEGRFAKSVRDQIVKTAHTHKEIHARDLFERIVPANLRIRKLGDNIHAPTLLSMSGDVQRGKQLFFGKAAQCTVCHRVGKEGSELGPDLTHVGKKLTPAKILENLLYPSKSIDPKYRTYAVATRNGKFYSGLIVRKTDKELVMKNAGPEPIRIPRASVLRMLPQQTSIMPDGLLREMTAEQAADLLAYLQSLK